MYISRVNNVAKAPLFTAVFSQLSTFTDGYIISTIQLHTLNVMFVFIYMVSYIHVAKIESNFVVCKFTMASFNKKGLH